MAGLPFSDTTNKNGIIQTCELLLDLGDAGISGNPTLLKQFTNLSNKAYDNVVSQILQNEGDYTWDDKNYTISDTPIAKINLSVVANSEVSLYTLPVANVNGASGASSDVTSFLRLIKAQVLDANGFYQNLRPISESMTDTPLETLFNKPGFPKAYKLIGSGIQIYPAPLAAMVTATAGLKVFFQRDKIDFVSTDTTKLAGFPAIYHYLIPLEMSETWAAIKGMKQLPFIQVKKAEFIKNLGWGIANENKDIRQRVKPINQGRSYE
jgi:hypothetical protein